MKYSDYANDLVLADILSYLLLQSEDITPFLNNANMNEIGATLRRLIAEVEKEMYRIADEKGKMRRAGEPSKDIAPEKYLDSVLKGSRFKSTLQITHKHKLSLHETRAPLPKHVRNLRYHFRKRYLSITFRESLPDLQSAGRQATGLNRRADNWEEGGNSQDSGSVTENQLEANFEALRLLKALLDVLDRSDSVISQELFMSLKAIRDHHHSEIAGIMQRKMMTADK